ncbi:MAG: peptide deformylase [Archaeoglobus sp.]|nr:peptide deformylase [Archaeoglobus sp.]
MPVKELLLLGNPLLRKRSTEVQPDSDEVREILEDLKDTLAHLQKEKGIGRALAAPQLGYLRKVVFVNVRDEKNPVTMTLINPRIVEKSKEMIEVWDSCYSFNIAFFVKIKRHRKIKVEYLDEKGRKIVEEFEDDLSEILQHEIDHLEGILATDHLRSGKDIIMREEWEKMYR